MNCPLCAYESQYAAMRCPGCRTVFDSEALETLWHLVYLRDRLTRWRADGILGAEAAEAALAAAEREIAELHVRLVPMAPSAATAGIAQPAAGQPAGPITSTAPGVVQEGAPLPLAIPAYGDGLGAVPLASQAVHAGPEAAAPVGDPVAAGDDEDDIGEVEHAAPGPSFAWRDVGTYLLSERTLHGLLGLGALLILASGVVISTLNPTGLGPIPHLGAVIATTLLFFVSGYVVRQRLHLTIAAATLLGIAGAFVPMTIWTLGQERLLRWETGAIWLVSSLVSLPLYLAVHRLLRDRTFAVLAAVAGGSEVLAVLNWIGVPLEWGLATLALLATGYVRLAWRLRGSGPELAWALTRTAQVFVPLVLAALLFARFGSDAWLAAFGRPLGGWGRYAIAAGWWLGTLFYLQRARLFGGRWDGYVVAWVLPFAYILTLGLIPGDGAWGGFCLGVLAPGYLLAGYVRQFRGEPAALPPTYRALAGSPYFQVCTALVVVAGFWPLQHDLSRIATLYLLAGIMVLATALLRLRGPAWVSMLLLGVAFGLTLEYRDVPGNVRPLAWSILAAVLLAAGEVVIRRTREAGPDGPVPITWGWEWRSRLGAPLFAAGYLSCGIALVLGLGEYWRAPAQAGVRRLSEPAIYGFVALLATLTASSIARRTDFFLYVVPWLALIPLTAGAAIVSERAGWPLREPEVARLLAAASAAWLAIAWLVDRGDGRYARPLYLAGYLLLPGAMLLSVLDRTASLQVVGFGIAVYVVSAWLTHVGRLPSWERLVERLCGASAAAPSVRALWVYLAVWLAPAWAMILTNVWDPPIAGYALVLSVLALAYPAIGLWIRRVRLEYRWPWYLGGYALSAIAPLVAITDTAVRPAVLGLSVALYVASAIVAKRSAWLYPAAILGPVVLWWALGSLEAFERWYGIGLIALAVVYGVVGLWLQPFGAAADGARPGRLPLGGTIGRYALPFLVVGYVLSALGLARAANQGVELATFAFALGAVLYAASAVVFRQSVFGWATAGLTVVAYVVGLTLTPLDPLYRGLGLLPAGALALLVGEVLRRRIDRSGDGYGWSLPWYVVVCGVAVAEPFTSTGSSLVWALGWWGGALLFAAMTAALRQPLWLYPTFGFGIVAYFVTGRLAEPPLTPSTSFATLAVLTWLFLGLACLIERRWPSPTRQPQPADDGPAAPVQRPALGDGEGDAPSAGEGDDPAGARLREVARRGRSSLGSWTAPLQVAGWVTLVLACAGSLPNARAALAATLAIGVLQIVLALLRVKPGYAWVSVAVLALACQHGLRVAEVAGHLQPVYWAGASLAAVLLSLRLPAEGSPRIALWRLPLSMGSGVMATGALAAALFVEATLLNREALQALALTLAIVGLTAIGHAFARRERLLAYLGIGLLDLGLLLELLAYEVGQPQAFALPVGGYLLIVAYLEWRRGTTRTVKRLLESGALIVLLGVSLLQAIGFMGAGYDRYAYATLLLLEAAGLLGLGAILRWRYTFFAGALALIVDVGILLVDPLRALNTWYLVALIGLVLIGAVIWIERQRQKIPFWLDDLRARLETWD